MREHGVRLPEWFVEEVGTSAATPEAVGAGPVPWLEWAAANTPAPEPMKDALDLEAAQAVLDTLRTVGEPILTEVHGRCRLGMGAVVDVSGPLD